MNGERDRTALRKRNSSWALSLFHFLKTPFEILHTPKTSFCSSAKQRQLFDSLDWFPAFFLSPLPFPSSIQRIIKGGRCHPLMADAGMSGWVSRLGIVLDASLLEQRIETSDGESQTIAARRGVFVRRQVPKGASIVIVPVLSALTGQTAALLLQQMKLMNVVVSAYRNVIAPDISRAGLVLPHTTRDSLAIVVVLALHHLLSTSTAASNSNDLKSILQLPHPAGLSAWLSSFPRQVPPIGALIRRGMCQPHSQRHRFFLHSTAQQHVAPHTNSSAMRQQSERERARVASSGYAALDDAQVSTIGAAETFLQKSVLAPLSEALGSAIQRSIPQNTEFGDLKESLASAMHWAHFMLRSRAVCLRPSPTSMVPALIPFLDMVNHSAKTPNVTFASPSSSAVRTVVFGQSRFAREGPQQQAELSGCRSGMVVVSASRRIDAGEELLMDYSNLQQRGEMLLECQSALGVSAASGRAVTNDAAWVWMYGFHRTASEREYEAACTWDEQLTTRIANMTDIRRRGRPGEFVVGVPEGLEHLRMQREALNQQYGRVVFPEPPKA